MCGRGWGLKAAFAPSTGFRLKTKTLEQEGAFGVGPPYVSSHIPQSESQHLRYKCLATCPAALEVPRPRGNPA